MMRTLGSIRLISLLAGFGFCAALMLAGESAAQDDPIERFSISGQFGIGALAMGDVNDRIAQGNADLLRPQNLKEVNDVSYAFNFAGDLRARLNRTLSLSVGGGLTSGKSGVDYDHVIGVEPKAFLFYLRGMYELPFRPRRNLIVRIGGGPVYLSSAELTVSHEFRSVDAGTTRLESVTFESSGWGAQGWLEGELVIGERLTIVGDLGYRRAVLSRGDYDWSVTGLSCPQCMRIDPDIEDQYSFDSHSFLIHSFLEVIRGDDGRARTDDHIPPRTLTEPKNHWKNMDFSGVQGSVGLRLYLF